MNAELQRRVASALERAHRMGTIGGELESQIEHSLAFGDVVADQLAIGQSPDAGRFSAVDLGSGGGIPGLILAAVFPMSLWTLVEIRAARADELERAAVALDLTDRVQVVAARVEEVADSNLREQADLVTARSFGPPAVTAECSAGLVRVGGTAIVSEAPSGFEDRWPVVELHRLGFAAPTLRVERDRRFVVLDKVAPVPEGAPRRQTRRTRGWFTA